MSKLETSSHPSIRQYEQAIKIQKELKPSFKKLFSLKPNDMDTYGAAVRIIKTYEQQHPEAYHKRQDALLAQYNGSRFRWIMHLFAEAAASCFRLLAFILFIVVSAIPFCIYQLIKGLFFRRK